MEFVSEACTAGIPEDFERGYLALSAKYAEGGESLDKDFYEYVCESILGENEIQESVVSEIVRSFYPDYAIDEDDVASFTRAAQGLCAMRSPAAAIAPADDPCEAELPQLPDELEALKEEKDIWTEQNVEDISYVCSIFPNIDISIIEYAYMSKCARNKDPTVEYLLENCSDDAGIERVAAKMAEKREKEQRDTARAAEEARKMQAMVFQKYGDRVVVTTGGGKSIKKEEKVNLVLENPVSRSGGKGKSSKVSLNASG